MKNLILVLTILFSANLFSVKALAKVVTEPVTYKEGNTELHGFVVYDNAKAAKGKLPGVVVVHDWMGVSDYVKMRATQLADMGYVAFVADIYGAADTPKDQKQAAVSAGKYRSGDRKLLRARAEAAYNELKKNKFVNADKISATGYCFGGSTVLEMARMGLPLKGIVSFHGGLASNNPEDAKNIKAKVLVLHGALDPYESKEEVVQFQKEMNDAKIDYVFTSYSGAVHAFTQKQAGDDISKGAAYNENADKRSYIAAKEFLEEVNK